MTYTLSYDQVRAIAWNLSISEALVMNWICGAKLWASDIKLDDGVYYFASKTKCINDLPHVVNKPDTAYRLYKKLADKGLIKLVKLGIKDYVAITELGATWGQALHENSEVLAKAEQETREKRNSEINPSIGNKSEDRSEINPTYYSIKEKDSKIKRTNLLETPSGSLKSSSNPSPQTSEPLPKKKFKEFDTYENIFLSQEKVEQYILDKFQEYEDYAIGDILSLITQAVNDYGKKNRHLTHKNTEAFVDRWISRNIYSSNTVIHPNESQSYKHLSTRELVQMVDLNAEMIYKILTPPESMFVPITPFPKKLRNLLSDDLDD